MRPLPVSLRLHQSRGLSLKSSISRASPLRPGSVGWTELRDCTLQFSVYDFDRFSRNDLIGQVVLKGVADHCHPDIETDYLLDILNTRQVSICLGGSVGWRWRWCVVIGF